MIYLIILIICIFVIKKLWDSKLLGKILKLLLKVSLALFAIALIFGLIGILLDNFGVFKTILIVVAIIAALSIIVLLFKGAAFLLGNVGHIFKGFTYKRRVKNYVTGYVCNIINGTDRNNKLTEKCFFSCQETKNYLNERDKFKGVSTREYLKSLLRNTVLSAFKTELYNKIKERNRILFYYEFYNYMCYLEEQNMDPARTFNGFGILNVDFLYFDDAAFLSKDIYNKVIMKFWNILQQFKNSLEPIFTADKPFFIILQNGLLNEYISPEHLKLAETLNAIFRKYSVLDSLDKIDDEIDSLLIGNKNSVFYENYMSLFSEIYETGFNNGLNNGMIHSLNVNDEKCDEELFQWNHENSDGIIEEEFGMEHEAHRDTKEFSIDIPPEQLVELNDCPA